MDSKRKLTAMVVILLALIGVFAIFKARDQEKRVIARKTGYDLPDYCSIEKYIPYGSMFNRKGFEAKIKIDTADNMSQVISDMNQLLGDDYGEITLAEYNVIKYDLFGSTKLVPAPTATSWEIVGRVKSGSLVVFICIENELDFYMYMYYND